LETRKQIAKEIHDACSTCGFFYLKNHQLPVGLLEETFDVIKRFFALDVDIKMDAYVHKNPAIRGYEPMMHSNVGKGGTQPYPRNTIIQYGT
jgi:isopenicillin N synthase-like dioxygenase